MECSGNIEFELDMLIAKKDINHNGELIKAGETLPEVFSEEEKQEMISKEQAEEKVGATVYEKKCRTCHQVIKNK